MLLQLTRAAYFGAALGFLFAGAIWWFRRGPIRGAARRRLIFVPVLIVLLFSLGAAVSKGERHLLSTVGTRALAGYSDASSTSGTVEVRVNVGKEMLRLLGPSWPIGLGFIHPAAHPYPTLPNGSIRDTDLGVLNVLMLMGAVGAILLYLPLLLVLRGLSKAPPARDDEQGDEWLRLGAAIWIIGVIASSLTLVDLFSFGGLAAGCVHPCDRDLGCRRPRARRARMTAGSGSAVGISAVVVTYNSAHCVEECLTSIVEQLQPHEIIVVDNASSDALGRSCPTSSPECDRDRAGHEPRFRARVQPRRRASHGRRRRVRQPGRLDLPRGPRRVGVRPAPAAARPARAAAFEDARRHTSTPDLPVSPLAAGRAAPDVVASHAQRAAAARPPGSLGRQGLGSRGAAVRSARGVRRARRFRLPLLPLRRGSRSVAALPREPARPSADDSVVGHHSGSASSTSDDSLRIDPLAWSLLGTLEYLSHWSGDRVAGAWCRDGALQLSASNDGCSAGSSRIPRLRGRASRKLRQVEGLEAFLLDHARAADPGPGHCPGARVALRAALGYRAPSA